MLSNCSKILMPRDDEIKDVCDWFERLLAEHRRKVTELMIRTENLEAGLRMLKDGRLRDAMKKKEAEEDGK